MIRSISLLVLAAAVAPLAAAAEAPRRTISLDGQWQIAEGRVDGQPPTEFTHTAPVPGLVDMAQPAFAAVGHTRSLRGVFWYRRTFRVEVPLSAAAVLKVHKAMFGCKVVLNGKPLGEHVGGFTPALFDARAALQPGENELLIRIIAGRSGVRLPGHLTGNSEPRLYVPGFDGEKSREIPGIYDSVDLILSGAPHIARLQAVPDIADKRVTIHAWLGGVGAAESSAAAKVRLVVREARSGRVVGQGELDAATTEGIERHGQATIALADCRLWSPEAPFLYEVEARTSGDRLTARFGMRSFRLDPHTGHAVLNGHPYFMRGSNVCIFRFMEDSQRGDKPWREEWVRRLHKKFHDDMHWNCLRYCIGFPPDFWYTIADEEGILIQDEYPLWFGGTPKVFRKPGSLTADDLVADFKEWLGERWNHPSVVIWDACNETHTPETAAAIAEVRGLDYSGRPWDDGQNKPAQPGDSLEMHPYHFGNPNFHLEDLATDAVLISPYSTAGWAPGRNPIIINEYLGLWLNRDGMPTARTRERYERLLGPNATPAARLRAYARCLAAETEYWRSLRTLAAVMEFCALGYSRPDGITSDHWTDVEKLTWQPDFSKYVRDSFAPVGVMIAAWDEKYQGGAAQRIPIVVVNDREDTWQGTVRLRLSCGGETVAERSQPVRVAGAGRKTLSLTLDLPARLGRYQAEATLLRGSDEAVHSLRDFDLVGAADYADYVVKRAARSELAQKGGGPKIFIEGPLPSEAYIAPSGPGNIAGEAGASYETRRAAKFATAWGKP